MASPFFLYPFCEGDLVTLRKQHPCGGKEWEVFRVGADITLVCMTCGHRLVLTRRVLEKSCLHVKSKKDKDEQI